MILNHMVHNSNSDLDAIFHALADKTRRDILARLAKGEQIISELARTYDMSLTAVSKHIKVLEKAGLVITTKEGRVHRCTMQFEPLEVASKQIDFYKQFWTQQLDVLDQYVQDLKRQNTSQEEGNDKQSND
jgi:DNA-binding transcriptional ArsR family regulator